MGSSHSQLQGEVKEGAIYHGELGNLSRIHLFKSKELFHFMSYPAPAHYS